MGFVKALWAQKGLLLGSGAVVALALAAEKFVGVSIPEEFLWFLLVLCLVLLAYRVWNLEHLRRVEKPDASAAPQVLVHFDCDSGHPKPLALINTSEVPAFNVRIEDLRGANGVARFDVVPRLLREWVTVSPRIEGGPDGKTTGQTLMTFLAAPAPVDDSGLKLFPLRVSYDDFKGRDFHTQYVIHYDEQSQRAVARLIPETAVAGRRRAKGPKGRFSATA